MDKSEVTRALFTILIFDLLSSSSNEPSKTIKISPIVPMIGSNGVRSGMLKLKIVDACLTSHPESNNKITDGILVRGEVMSKKYANSKRTQNVIIMAAVISSKLVAEFFFDKY